MNVNVSDLIRTLHELHGLISKAVGELGAVASFVEGMAATMQDQLKKPDIAAPVRHGEEHAKDHHYSFRLKQWLPQYAHIAVMAKDLEEATCKALIIARGQDVPQSGWQWGSAYDHEDEAKDFVLDSVAIDGGEPFRLNAPVLDAEEGK